MPVAESKSDILQGTLDLMVLKTLEAMGPMHGYGIARRIEQISDDILELNEGTVYASLMRLQHQRWISASTSSRCTTLQVRIVQKRTSREATRWSDFSPWQSCSRLSPPRERGSRRMGFS